MNLYKIKFSHTAPKDSKEGIIEYLLAENDEQVFEYIDKEFDNDWNEHQIDDDDFPNQFDLFDEDYNKIGTETFKEKMIRIKGEINDEDYDFSDSYYGITLYGWELVKENVNIKDFTNVIELKIIKEINDN